MRDNRLRLIFGATSVVLAGVTLIVYFLPGVDYAVNAPELDEVINTVAVVIAGSVSVRAWVRYHETHELESLLAASAFLILFVDGLLRLVLALINSPLYAGYTAATPGQAPLYGWTVRRLLAAALLLAAVLVAGRTPRLGRLAVAATLFVPAAVALLFSLFVLNNQSLLPVLVPPEDLQRLLVPGQTFDTALVSVPLLITQLAIGVLFGAAALLEVRSARRGGQWSYSVMLSVALLFAAVSQVHYALVPGVYTQLVPSGDFLRLGFYVLVLAAVAVATADDLGQLRKANSELEVLRAGEAERAAAAERARLAREIHDGISQELWLARLTTGSLAQSANLQPEEQEVVSRLDSILDRALAEARQAIVTLQPETGEHFGELLQRYVDDYADHFGMDIKCVADGDATPAPHAQAELLRICREALNNARKHADASVVRVRLAQDAEGISLSIADNGGGFDAAQVRSGFGLESMRQRAESLGARLEIKSAPMDGTRVTVRLPSTAVA